MIVILAAIIVILSASASYSTKVGKDGWREKKETQRGRKKEKDRDSGFVG